MLFFLSLQAVTQLELFGDMSTPPDVTSPPVSIQGNCMGSFSTSYFQHVYGACLQFRSLAIAVGRISKYFLCSKKIKVKQIECGITGSRRSAKISSIFIYLI